MSKYSDLIILQYRKKSKAKATIDAIMREVDLVLENIEDLGEQWDIDKARNYSLDIIGRRVGVSRTLPSFVSKGYFGYLTTVDAKPWGEGVWYRYGESAGEALSLNDEDYRFLIKAKILKNFQNGTLDYIVDALQRLMSEYANAQDNLDMSVEIFLPIQSLNSLQRYMIERMDILPRPMGVQYKFTNVSGKEFGFNGFFNSYGFNEGSFIDT